MSHTVAAMSLRPGDVAHIADHQCHGKSVNCGDHNIEVTGIHPANDNRDVVIDYAPLSTWPGCSFHSGTVAYERTSRVDLLWHDEIGGAA